MSTFKLIAPYARRFPDPIHGSSQGTTRHIFFVPARQIPPDVPKDANARSSNIRRRVYREVEKSLLNAEGEPDTFHLKNKGMTWIAESVTKVGEGEYDIEIVDGQGIMDGGHTYDIIVKDRDQPIPASQFVKIEVLTDIPEPWIPEIAGGLNTAVQVQPMSLDNLRGDFDWVKDELKSEPYFESLAWKENDPGDFDARDLVAIMTLFNIYSFPNESDADQPIEAYERKSSALQRFEDRPQEYEKLRPILKDILWLHDTVRRDAREHWNASGGKAGALAFVEARKRGEFEFPFTGKSAQFRLMNGALYPMLGAFRWMVEENPKNGKARWRGGRRALENRWEASAAELMRMTVQTSNDLGRNPNAVGKSRSHWANLHARVALRDVTASSA